MSSQIKANDNFCIIIIGLDLILETVTGCATSGQTLKTESVMSAFWEVGI